ncbi:MAG: tetratricopeptide repeat protein [Acidobacteriota bacterium]
MKSKILIRAFLLSLLSVIFIASAAAQAGRGKGRLKGTVVDNEGNPISSAAVVIEFLENQEFKMEAETDEKGEWVFFGLGTGMWRVTASAEGFIPAYTDVYIRQLERNPTVTLTLKKMEPTDKPIIKDEASLDLLEKGNQLLEEGKYKEALSLFEEFLTLNPLAYQSHLFIGDAYREMGDYDKAVEEYEIVLKKAEEDETTGLEITAKALAAIGELHLKKGDLKKAQKFFEESIEKYSENEILPYNVGEIYFSNQNIDQAIRYFETAIKINPEWADPYLKLGYVYLNKGDNLKAIENFEKFLKLEPDSERSAQVENILNYIKK